MIDRKVLRDSLAPQTIIELLNLLGATEYEDHDNYIQFKTICHNHSENDSAKFNLSYYKNNHRFYCFSNCHSMDIVDLIGRRWDLLGYEDTHYSTIVDWIMNQGKIDVSDLMPSFVSAINPKDFQNKTTEIIIPEKPITALDTFTDKHCIEWLSDGISDEAMTLYNIKYSISRNAIIIPHYDVHDRLVGIRRRALNPEDIERGKYKPVIIEKVSYSHPLGHNLYGLNIVKDEARRQRRVIVAEGEKAALQGRTIWGDRNIVVAACGSKINRWQVHLLLKYCDPNEIIIAFDKGLDYDKIHAMCEKYSGYCDFSYLCDTQDWLKDKESPLDRPDVLQQLIDRRVKVQ